MSMTERRQGRIFIVAQDAVKISDMANISKAGYFPLIFENVGPFVIYPGPMLSLRSNVLGKLRQTQKIVKWSNV